jgi:tetratricopeptide (TPR) repeat protein
MLYEIYGESHPEIAQTLGNVAAFLMEVGDMEAAEEMVHRELELNLELLGPEHFRVADSYQALAEIAIDRGEYGVAETHARHAVEIYRKVYPGGRHVKVSSGEGTLGYVYLMQGRTDEAERLLLASYEMMEAVQDRTLYRMAALESLIELYEITDRPDQAAEYRARLAALEEEAGG